MRPTAQKKQARRDGFARRLGWRMSIADVMQLEFFYSLLV